MNDPDTARIVAMVLAIIVFGGLAALLIGTWLRDPWRAARVDTRALHAELAAEIDGYREDDELRNHLLDLGFTEHDLQIHHMVVGNRVVYTIPRAYFVAHVKHATELHRQVIEGLAGHQTARTRHLITL